MQVQLLYFKEHIYVCNTSFSPPLFYTKFYFICLILLADVISELCSIGLSQSVITNIIVQSRLAISRCQTVASEDQIINGVQGIASTFLNHVTEILNSVLTRAYQWLRDSSTCATAGALSGSAANTKSEAIQAIHFFTIVQVFFSLSLTSWLLLFFKN